MIIGASILASATIAAFMVANQENESEGNNAVSHSNTNRQSDSKNNADDENKEDANGSETGSGTESDEKALSTTEASSDPNSAAAAPAEGDAVTSNTGTQQTGLYFATREEAIAFGFSRFTAEEIEIYNRASANGLTPEQEKMAIQMAYSRFSAEEIAAIEDALNR